MDWAACLARKNPMQDDREIDDDWVAFSCERNNCLGDYLLPKPLYDLEPRLCYHHLGHLEQEWRVNRVAWGLHLYGDPYGDTITPRPPGCVALTVPYPPPKNGLTYRDRQR